MKAFDDWIRAEELKDDIALSSDDFLYTVEFVKKAFRAGMMRAAEEKQEKDND